MSTSRILVLVAALLSTGTAMAQCAAEPQRLPSRAEVLADLEIYQRSGLRTAEQQDLQQYRGSSYQAALARYQALRRSPEFAARVAAIAERRGETVSTTAP